MGKNGESNTPLVLIHKVNFKIEDINYQIEDDVMAKFKAGDTDKLKLDYMIKHYNNVVKQIDIKWRVIK